MCPAALGAVDKARTVVSEQGAAAAAVIKIYLIPLLASCMGDRPWPGAPASERVAANGAVVMVAAGRAQNNKRPIGSS